MKYARHFISAALVLIVIGMVCTAYAWEPLTFVPEKHIPKAETVFVGRVVQLTEKYRGEWGSNAEAKVEILDVYKGPGLKKGDFIYIGYSPFIECTYPDPCIEADFKLGTEVLFVIQDYIGGNRHDFDVFFKGGIDFALEVNDGGHRSDRYETVAADEKLEYIGLNCRAMDLRLSKQDLKGFAKMPAQ